MKILGHDSITVRSSVPPRQEVIQKADQLMNLVSLRQEALGSQRRSDSLMQASGSGSATHSASQAPGPSRTVERQPAPALLALPGPSRSLQPHAVPVQTYWPLGAASRTDPESAQSPVGLSRSTAQQHADNADVHTRRLVRIAPQMSVNDPKNLIILQQPQQKLIIKKFREIAPKPDQALLSHFAVGGSAKPTKTATVTRASAIVTTATSATGVSTTSTTITTTCASNNSSLTLLASSSTTTSSQIYAGSLRPKTLHEQQIIHRIGEIAQQFSISPNKLVTPPRANPPPLGPSTSTPLAPSADCETSPEGLQRPKRKLTFAGDDNEELSPIKIPALDNSQEIGPEDTTFDGDSSWHPSQSRCSISDEDRSYREEEDDEGPLSAGDNIAATEEIEVDAQDTDPDELLFVSLKNLLHLLKYCSRCGKLNTIKKMRTGAYMSFKCTCQNGHVLKWATHEIFEKKPIINIKLATSMLLTGQNFASFSRLAKLLNLQIFAKDTYQGIIENYAKPVLCTRWASRREEKLTKIRSETFPCSIGGDARFDSRGKAGAKFGIYTMMESESSEILDFVIMQKGIEPGELESKGFMISMSRIVDAVGADRIKAFCSDRNYTVGRRMKDYFPMIYHAFDVSRTKYCKTNM